MAHWEQVFRFSQDAPPTSSLIPPSGATEVQLFFP